MTELKHDSPYYKGLGNMNMDDCLKRYDKLKKDLIVCLFLTVATIVLSAFIPYLSKRPFIDCVLIGISFGLDFALFVITHSQMQKYKLRMKELEVIE